MADKLIFANNASATLASTLLVGGLSAVLTAGQGAKFPSPAAGQYFKATLTDVSGNKEIVHATARSSDTITITRAQEGTTAREFPAGSLFEICVTKGVLEEMLQRNEYGLNKITEVTVTPPTNANYTLTEAEYSAHTINLNLVNWTTDRSIIVPNEDRKWDINNPSSTRSATIKTAAGSGKVVIAGTTRPLYCDGTNVLNPITAVSGIKQLEVATNSSGNVSRFVASLPSNGTNTGYWFKFATIQMNAQQYRDVTLSLRVLSKVNLSGHLDVLVNLRQDVSTFSRSRSVVRVQSAISTATSYIPMFCAVAPADALNQAVDLWIQAPANYMELVVIEIGKSYVDTESVTYYSTGSWQLAEPSGGFIVKSYGGSAGGRQLGNVIDTSDMVVDTMLQPGETAICSWTSATSKALRINTTNGGVYELTWACDMGTSDTYVSLNPNNTNYSLQMWTHNFRANSTTAAATVANDSNFQLGYGQRHGIGGMGGKHTINIGPNIETKMVLGQARSQVGGNLESRNNNSIWQNNSTAWTSLGTLTFGNACSGTATIKRIS